MRPLIAIILFLFGITWAQATQEGLQIGLSDESVSISSNFDGKELVVFGTIENGVPDDLTNARYDVVVVIVGPEENVVVRRKELRFGFIWINGEKHAYDRVPSFYSLAANRALVDVASPAKLTELQLGFSNLKLMHQGKSVAGTSKEEFRASLSRLKQANDLALERNDGVKFLSPSLFRAKLKVPANVPIGRHVARAYLFKKGHLIAKKSARLAVRKIGFEQYTYDLAHKHGLLYGILAVLIAIATGWLASVVFRKD